MHKFGHLSPAWRPHGGRREDHAQGRASHELYGSWRNAFPHFLGSSGVRVLLVAELVAFCWPATSGPGHCNSSLTLWVSTLLIVASHDFEEDADEDVADTDDWGVDQLETGLRPEGGRESLRRLLPVGGPEFAPRPPCLPYQRSGFANIATEDVLREEAARSASSGFPRRVS